MQPTSSATPAPGTVGITYRIPFNRPTPIGHELDYVAHAVKAAKLATDGEFNRRCVASLGQLLGVPTVLLTSSCTAALEMAMILAGVKPGDEVLLPSYTFVSTANAVVRAGGVPVFVDIRADTLNLDEQLLAAAITQKTKVIAPVHYAGVGCAMGEIMALAEQHGLRVVEDAAHSLNASYRGKKLGTIGHFNTFSFHETKNFIAGEGGALVVRDPADLHKAEILRNKGTDRARFDRGEVSRYTWVGVGSSYGPSELNAAFLCAQLEQMADIDSRRRTIWQRYYDAFLPLQTAGALRLPVVPADCDPNAHIFFVLMPDGAGRVALQQALAARGVQASTHYVPLHSSPYGKQIARVSGAMTVTDDTAARLVRLPLYHSLTDAEQAEVIAGVLAHFGG